MKKLTRNQFIERTNEGPIKIDDNLNYIAVKMNSNQVKMNETLKKQLINENLYDNSYVGVFIKDNEKAPFSMQNLPIYGRTDKYETKHLKPNLKEAVMGDLRERGLKLLDRELEARKLEVEAN